MRLGLVICLATAAAHTSQHLRARDGTPCALDCQDPTSRECRMCCRSVKHETDWGCDKGTTQAKCCVEWTSECWDVASPANLNHACNQCGGPDQGAGLAVLLIAVVLISWFCTCLAYSIMGSVAACQNVWYLKGCVGSCCGNTSCIAATNIIFGLVNVFPLITAAQAAGGNVIADIIIAFSAICFAWNGGMGVYGMVQRKRRGPEPAAPQQIMMSQIGGAPMNGGQMAAPMGGQMMMTTALGPDGQPMNMATTMGGQQQMYVVPLAQPVNMDGTFVNYPMMHTLPPGAVPAIPANTMTYAHSSFNAQQNPLPQSHGVAPNTHATSSASSVSHTPNEGVMQQHAYLPPTTDAEERRMMSVPLTGNTMASDAE